MKVSTEGLQRNLLNRLVILLLLALSALLAVIVLISLGWRYQHDSPIMLYSGFLVDRFGMLPYRDFLEMNMPGAILAYYLIGKFTAYSDPGVRIADLLMLLCMLALTWILLRPLSRRVAWGGLLLWGLCYLGLGPDFSLQREYVLLLPVIAGIVALRNAEWASRPVRSMAAGLMFALAGTMKPHAVIGLPVLLLFEALEIRAESGEPRYRALIWPWVRQALIPGTIGFAIPLVATLSIMEAAGMLAPFLDVARNYWPLYAKVSGSLEIVTGFRRLAYLVYGQREGINTSMRWAFAAPVGIYLAAFQASIANKQKRLVWLLVALALVYAVYPVFSGKYFPYYWLPLLYFAVLLSSLCLVELQDGISFAQRLYPLAIFAIGLYIALPFQLPVQYLMGQRQPPPKEGRVDEIAAFLKANLQPGETVQPLDWTAGAIHGMLLARARVATSFTADVGFYHDISNPYIQGLRRRFMNELNTAMPRFIIDMSTVSPRIVGPDTTTEFPELQAFIQKYYLPAYTGNGFIIYERNPALMP